MSSPFLCAEPTTFGNKKETKETKEIPKQHPGVVKAIESFSKIVEEPKNLENHLDFVSRYINLLGDNQSEILPVFNTIGNSKETNLFSLIYNTGSQDGPWNVFQFFATIISMCTKVAQTNENSAFILQCVMLSNNDNSPVFNYTELLHNQSQSGSDMYNSLNEKFLEKFKSVSPTFENEPEKEKEKEKELEKSDDDKKNLEQGMGRSKKIGLTLSVFVLVMALSYLIYYFVIMKKNPVVDILSDM